MSFFLQIPIVLVHSFSCSVVLVLVSQHSSSSQQLVTLARARMSAQLQQPAVRSRRKAGPEEGKAVGVPEAEGDTLNGKHQKYFRHHECFSSSE